MFVTCQPYSTVSIHKHGHKKLTAGSRRGLVVRASSISPDSSGPGTKIAPLQLESPIGQFLSQILVSHPHLVPAAVEQQLEQLQTDRDSEKQNVEEPSAAGTDLVLYRFVPYLMLLLFCALFSYLNSVAT